MSSLHESWISKLPTNITLRRKQTPEIIEATYQTAREVISPDDGDEIDAALKSAKSNCLNTDTTIASFNSSLLWGVGPEVNHSVIRAKEAEEEAFRARLGGVSDDLFKELKKEAEKTPEPPRLGSKRKRTLPDCTACPYRRDLQGTPKPGHSDRRRKDWRGRRVELCT